MTEPPSLTRVSPEKFGASLDSFVGLIELDPSGAIVYANPRYLEITGYTLSEIRGKHHLEICADERSSAEEYKKFWEKIKRGETSPLLVRRPRKDGSSLWVESSFCTLQSSTGELERILNFCIDVTRHVENARMEKSVLEAFHSVTLIAEYSLEGKFIRVNENFLDLLGVQEKDLLGKGLIAVFPSLEFGAQPFKEVWAEICAGQNYYQCMQWQTADGIPVWLETIFIRVFSPQEGLKKIIQISMDVSARLKEEQKNGTMLQRLLLVMDKTHNAVVMTDPSSNIIYTNTSFERSFGDFLGRSPTSMLGAGENEFLRKARQAMNRSGTYLCEEVVHTANGRRIWVSWLMSAALNNLGKREYNIHVIRDITNHKLQERLLESALEGLTRNNPTESILQRLCQEAERIFWDTRITVLGIDPLQHVYKFAATGAPELQKKLQKVSMSSEGASCALAGNNDDAALEKTLESSCYPSSVKSALADLGLRVCLEKSILSPVTGKVTGLIAFHYPEAYGQDPFLLLIITMMARICAIILEREPSRGIRNRPDYTKPLGDLPNRNLLTVYVEKLLAPTAHSFTNCPMAVLHLNIDRFQLIMGTLEHKMGEELLRTIARRVQKLKNPEDLLGRISADEFILVLHNCTAARAKEIAEHMRESLTKNYSIKGMDISFSVRIGISLYPVTSNAKDRCKMICNNILLFINKCGILRQQTL